jgi:hypothetical protein
MSTIFEEATALREHMLQLRKEREERAEKRVRCVICKAKVGQCKPFRQRATTMKVTRFYVNSL